MSSAITVDPLGSVNIVEIALKNTVAVFAPALESKVSVPAVLPEAPGVFAFSFGSNEVILFGNGSEVGYNG